MERKTVMSENETRDCGISDAELESICGGGTDKKKALEILVSVAGPVAKMWWKQGGIGYALSQIESVKGPEAAERCRSLLQTGQE